MSNPNIDYFAKPKSLEEAVIRRVKGDYRRAFIAEAIKRDGLDSIPPQWTAHELDEPFKAMLTSLTPRNRGGEDLPDLDTGEVEIARVSLADSVHGEVTSLRVRRDGNAMALRLVDEYETEFALPRERITRPFTDAELVEFLADCEPCPLDTECRLRIASPFYTELQALLDTRLARRDFPEEERTIDWSYAEAWLERTEAAGRSSPSGLYWHRFWQWLERTVPNARRKPPPPFILAASGESAGSKLQRLRQQLTWASEHGILADAIAWLDSCPPERWNTCDKTRWRVSYYPTCDDVEEQDDAG